MTNYLTKIISNSWKKIKKRYIIKKKKTTN